VKFLDFSKINLQHNFFNEDHYQVFITGGYAAVKVKNLGVTMTADYLYCEYFQDNLVHFVPLGSFRVRLLINFDNHRGKNS
jgi:hypothetical protein